RALEAQPRIERVPSDRSRAPPCQLTRCDASAPRAGTARSATYGLRPGRDADNPGLHGPIAGVPPSRLASGRDPTAPRIGRPTGREEGVGGGAGDDTAATYCALSRRAVLLLALRTGAVGHAAAGDHLEPGRSRRPLGA